MEATVQLENYNLIANTEMWWDELHSWNIGMEGCKLYRRDRQGRSGGGVDLYVKKWIDCEEFPWRNSQEKVERLWVKIKDWTRKGHLVVGVYYRLLIIRSLLMRPSCSNYKKYRAHRLSSSWGISTTRMFAGKATWQK